MDPDVITGYNIQNFDLPYLISRAQTLKVGQAGRVGLSHWGLEGWAATCSLLPSGLWLCPWRVARLALYLQPTAPSGSRDLTENLALAPSLPCLKSRR